MNIDVFTLFPEWFEWFASQRHVANVLAAGSRLQCVNPRDHTPLSGGQVDDTPFGGGAGMVLRVDVLDSALRGSLRRRSRAAAPPPSRDRAGPGRAGCSTSSSCNELAGEPELTLLCGRYEGFDERILEHFAGDVVSIGRYVLSGGELAAMVVCDAVLRKLPEPSATSTRRSRSPSAPRWRATPSTPTTPARPSTAAGACPRSCCPAITSRSSAGGASAAANGAQAPPRRATVRLGSLQDVPTGAAHLASIFRAR